MLELAIPFEESDPRVDSAILTLRDDLVPDTLGSLDRLARRTPSAVERPSPSTGSTGSAPRCRW